MSIDKVFSKDDLTDIENNSSAGLVTIRIDGTKIKSNISGKTEVRQKVEKEEKKQKTKDTLKKLGKALFGNTTVKINGN